MIYRLKSKSESCVNNYLYTGEQFDPNGGFYYLRARYMDPSSGRFVTADPYQGRIYEPMTLHKYLYANVNPVMYSDPSGEMTNLETLAGLSMFSLLYAVGFNSISPKTSE